MQMEILVTLASLATRDDLIKLVSNQIEEYKIYQTEEKFEKLIFHIHILMINHAIKGDIKNVDKVLKELNNVKMMTSVFENNN